MRFYWLGIIVFSTLLLTGCFPNSEPATAREELAVVEKTPLAKIESKQKSILPSSTPITSQPVTNSPVPATLTPTTIPNTPTAQPSPTAVSAPTPTPIGPCIERMPEDDLLAVVTLDYNLSRNYEPLDLVPLAEWLPMSVTLGYPSEIRREALQPLLTMIEAMQAEGLTPRVMSGYRSYAAQAIAWNKWNDLYPDHASIISAPPGHSEHQLGTVVDFGSPELAAIVGQPDIEFHTLFYKTSEGIWLAEHAHEYGFTLSYPLDAFDLTGFYYEPWHYRYVGTEIATELHNLELTLTEYQLLNQDEPCIP